MSNFLKYSLPVDSAENYLWNWLDYLFCAIFVLSMLVALLCKLEITGHRFEFSAGIVAGLACAVVGVRRLRIKDVMLGAVFSTMGCMLLVYMLFVGRLFY